MDAKIAALCAAALVGGAAPADLRAEWIADAEAAFFFDDNVTRGQRESDVKSDAALLARATGGYYFQLGERTGATLGVTVQREQHLRYAGLSATGAGPSVAVRTKLGLGPQAPWIRLAASALRLDYDDDLRTGWLLSASAGAGARVSERVGLRAEVLLERHVADQRRALVRNISGAAFDVEGASLSLGADYMVTRATSVSAAYTYRTGDVVSSTRRHASIFGVSSAIARDPVFGPDTIAYKLDAHSHVVELRVSHALSERSSLNVGFARSFTYGDGGNDYYGNSLSASLIYNF